MKNGLKRCLAVARLLPALLSFGALAALAQPSGWLDDDPGAIWARPPGFYKDGEHWYAIIHVRPEVTRVALTGDFVGAADDALELSRTPDGKFWWLKGEDASFPRPPKAGDRYTFLLTQADGTQLEVQDPAARRVESSNLNARSIVTESSAYDWGDEAWSRPGWEYYVIYQLHPLRFSNRNETSTPLQRIAEEVDGDGTDDYLNELGITAIQLLPVNEFPLDKSWGYNPSFFYAVESSYGTPDQLKQLVDAAHQNGIAVILDVVLNHGGTGDNVLWQLAQDDIHTGTYYDGDTQWGPMINFDNDVARHFFVQNLVYLAREYHIDGFRFDFTRPIHDPADWNITVPAKDDGGWRFLREIREKLKATDPRIIMIAEEFPNDWYLTLERVDAPWGGDFHGPFDAQWGDAFHDRFKAALTGEHLGNLYGAFTEFGDSWHDAVLYAESHDEVGNLDDRIAKRGRGGKGWEMSQLAAAGSVLGRGIPMLFMGQEAGETLQFGQNDAAVPAETAPSWWDDRLSLDVYETNPGRSKVRLWYERMIEIRQADLDRLARGNVEIVHLHDENGVVAFSRDDGKYIVVLNFRDRAWDRYDIGVRGRYQELANTSWPAFNLGHYPEKTRGEAAHDIVDVPIPPYGAVVLVRWN